MSEIIGDFEFARTGRPEKYPWQEWTDGQTRKVRRGEDFTCEVDTLANSIYVYARRNGYRARTQRVAPDTLVFRLERADDTSTPDV